MNENTAKGNEPIYDSRNQDWPKESSTKPCHLAAAGEIFRKFLEPGVCYPSRQELTAIIAKHVQVEDSKLDPRQCPKCGGLNTHPRNGVGFEHERRCVDCSISFDAPRNGSGATPRTDYAFDGDSSVGVLPDIKTWQQAKEFSRQLERELISAVNEWNNCIDRLAKVEGENGKLERELNEALKWKEEDPRMLREQIRVADVAFNFQRDQLTAAQKEILTLKRDKEPALKVTTPQTLDYLAAKNG